MREAAVEAAPIRNVHPELCAEDFERSKARSSQRFVTHGPILFRPQALRKRRVWCAKAVHESADAPRTRQWLERIAKQEVVPVWPAHLYAEVANPLVRLARADLIDARRVGSVFGRVRRISADVGEAQALENAMAVALDRQLTVYDAAYVVLAEALEAPLVTADQRLAAATKQAVLLAD